MGDNTNSILAAPKRIPWNKRKLTGSKPSLRQARIHFDHGFAVVKLQSAEDVDDIGGRHFAVENFRLAGGALEGGGSAHGGIHPR